MAFSKQCLKNDDVLNSQRSISYRLPAANILNFHFDHFLMFQEEW